ncbi:MAG: hypothetical protein ACTJLL_00305 [Anaplasma sp.]
MSHKICETGHGSENDVTSKTNCRSGAPAAAGSNKAAGLGIGSKDQAATKDTSSCSNTDCWALTKEMYDNS